MASEMNRFLTAGLQNVLYRQSLSVRQRLTLELQLRSVGGTVLASHEDLASAIGTVREVVSKLLGEFKRSGLLETHRGRLLITNSRLLADSAFPTTLGAPVVDGVKPGVDPRYPWPHPIPHEVIPMTGPRSRSSPRISGPPLSPTHVSLSPLGSAHSIDLALKERAGALASREAHASSGWIVSGIADRRQLGTPPTDARPQPRAIALASMPPPTVDLARWVPRRLGEREPRQVVRSSCVIVLGMCGDGGHSDALPIDPTAEAEIIGPNDHVYRSSRSIANAMRSSYDHTRVD